MKRVPVLLACLALAACAVASAACAQLLGIEAVHDDPADGGGMGDDGPAMPSDAADDTNAVSETSSPLDAPTNPTDAADAGPTVHPELGCASPDGGPVLFFPSVSTFPLGMAMDATHIYVADSNGIRRCSIEGCGAGAVTVLPEEPIAFGVNDRHVLWNSGGDFTIADDNGFGVGGFPAGITLTKIVPQGSDIYLVDGQEIVHTFDGPDAATATIYRGETTLGTPVALAANAAYAFFVTFQDDAGLGRVVRCSPSGCGVGQKTLASIGDRTPPIAVDDSTVYWGDRSAQEIRACDVGGCPSGPRTIASGVTVDGLFAGPDALYWVTESNGVFKAHLDGTGASQVASGYRMVAVLANSACIYWLEKGFPSSTGGRNGNLKAIPQP